MVEGQAQGERRGRIELLVKLLTAKFGTQSPEVQSRLVQAGPGELDAMAERLLTAATLGEVLG